MTYIGGQRGYMFSGCRKASLGGGTTGRQCDIANYSGHQIKDENIDYDFSFVVVNGSWIDEKIRQIDRYPRAVVNHGCDTRYATSY